MAKAFLISISICFVLSMTLVADASLLEAEDFFAGHYYEIYAFESGEQRDWDYANNLASSATFMGRNGHLATVTSAAEDMFINELQIDSAGIGGQIWLGGVRDTSGNFMWVNGEGPIPHFNGGPLYANWGDGEPNNYLGVSENHLTTGFRGNQWNDEGFSPNAVNGYVVEYDLGATPVPEPLSFHILCAIGLIGLAIHKRRLAT